MYTTKLTVKVIKKDYFHVFNKNTSVPHERFVRDYNTREITNTILVGKPSCARCRLENNIKKGLKEWILEFL